ncbi:MAG: hypothetical protein RIG82_12135 [Phycisphaeraceae bacterium]
MSRLHVNVGWLLGGALVLTPAMAKSDVLLTGQTRSVRASAGDASGTMSDSKSASGFGCYDDSITFSYTSTQFGGGGTGMALQTSAIYPWVITGDGTGTGNGGAGVGTGFAGGTSYLQATFTVTSPTAYSLEGFISAPTGFNRASVILTGPSGEIAKEEIGEFTGSFGSVLFTGLQGFSGILLPGDYTITAEASANDDSFAGPQALFDFSLIVPEPASSLLALVSFPLVLRLK